jgi:cleavage and polyadenylation specificity factor subunit 2
MNSKVPLQGAELETYLQKERAAKEKEAARKAALERNQRMLEADEVDSESESDSDSDEEENEVSRALEADLAGDVDRRRKGERNADIDWTLDGDEGLTRQLLSYDIYLKGNVSKATSFFKHVGGQTPRYRMFPYVEKKRRVDEYGETIDVGMWLRKGKVLEEEREGDEMKEMKRNAQAEEDAKVLFTISFMVNN